MARSDLVPILQEMESEESTTTTTPADWSWICFRCHHAPSSSAMEQPTTGGASVVLCICSTLKSVLYRRAFDVSRHLETGCNLEYQRQVVAGKQLPLRRSSQTISDAEDGVGANNRRRLGRASFPPRQHSQHTGCCSDGITSDISASSSWSTSSSVSNKSSTVSKTPDTNRTGCGKQSQRNNYTECDNEWHNRHSSPLGGCCCCCCCAGQSSPFPFSSSSSSFSCLCNRIHPNGMTPIDISLVTHRRHSYYHNQQQQRHHTNRYNNDDKEGTTALYTKCKLQHRSYEDLKTLLENFTKQVQAVSADLVRLLEERHDLKQQIDMRNIAIEQLSRLQQHDDSSNSSSSCPVPTDNTSASNQGTSAAAAAAAAAAADGNDDEGLSTRRRRFSGQQQHNADIWQRTKEDGDCPDCFFETLSWTIRTAD